MKTLLEKTLSMKLAFIKGQIWDKLNEYECKSEQAKLRDPFRHIRRHYYEDFNRFVNRINKEIEEIEYKEVL